MSDKKEKDNHIEELEAEVERLRMAIADSLDSLASEGAKAWPEVQQMLDNALYAAEDTGNE